jgi:(4-O-methyl)-D-glucuronate---lignin esterase
MGEAAATEESWQQPSAAKRYTFTEYKPFTKDSPLLESGLLGPVTLSSVTPR